MSSEPTTTTMSEVPSPTTTTLNEDEMVWCGFDLPNRPCIATYQSWKYNTLPKLPEDNPFAKFTTLEYLEEHLDEVECVFYSPTSCYFDVDQETGRIMCDQQGCVIWYFDGIGVKTDSGQYVSPSLPEFLFRVVLESAIWTRNRGDLLDKTLFETCFKLYVEHYYHLHMNSIKAFQEAHPDLKYTEQYLKYRYEIVDGVNLLDNFIVTDEEVKMFEKLAEVEKLEFNPPNYFDQHPKLTAESQKYYDEHFA